LPTLPANAEGTRAALIVAVVGVVFANALAGPFQFDDWNVIANNPAVHSFGALWDTMPGIRPLLKFSYVANWVSGFGTIGFHGLNVILHAINALLVFAIVRRIMPRLGVDAGAAAPLAFRVALLFALHPAQTEAVTYVSGRSVSLMALFYLAAVLAHLQARALASAALFACALAAKENAWTLPVALLLVEGLEPRFRWRRALGRIAPHLAVLVVAAFASVLVPAYWRLLGSSLETRSLRENLLTQIDGQWYLITRPLLGLVLNIDPDLAVRTAWAPDLLAKGAALLALVTIGLRQWRRAPWLGFGLLWFFVHLLATNSFLPRTDVANDRALYLALLGPALLVAVGAYRCLPVRASTAVLAILALVLAGRTVLRDRDYRSEVALWEATAVGSPLKGRVWNNLGFARQQSGSLDGARAAYERAIAIDPDDYRARVNLGSLDAPAPKQGVEHGVAPPER
jgi:tetratricopeptide (TPR) repeat protein